MKSRKRLVLFITAGLCLLLLVICYLFPKRPDHVDEMHQELTAKYGEQVKTTIQAVETRRNEQFEMREWEVVGTRVLEYKPKQEFKAVGCIKYHFEEDNPEIESFSVFLYVFQFEDEDWQYAAQFHLDSWPYWSASYTYRDYDFLDATTKATLGELPGYEYWNCVDFERPASSYIEME